MVNLPGLFNLYYTCACIYSEEGNAPWQHTRRCAGRSSNAKQKNKLPQVVWETHEQPPICVDKSGVEAFDSIPSSRCWIYYPFPADQRTGNQVLQYRSEKPHPAQSVISSNRGSLTTIETYPTQTLRFCWSNRPNLKGLERMLSPLGHMYIL